MSSLRYRYQELFTGLGPEGQIKIRGASVLVAGCGAMGGTIASLLVRAGVGRVRIIDRDFLELSNLPRQMLYDENDLECALPKAILAERKLKSINTEVKVEGIVADLNPENILEIIADVNLILDGLDNQETRYLINDGAVFLGRPWIFAGCVGSVGNVMTIIPEKTPCLRCLFKGPVPLKDLPTCSTNGVIGPTPNLVASIVAVEALKLLSGAMEHLLPGMFVFDLWNNSFHLERINIGRDDDCPCCKKRKFDFLEGRGWQTTTLCGYDAIQVNPPKTWPLSLRQVVQRLAPPMIISSNEHLVRFQAEGYYFSVFPDGRVIIQGTEDHGLAKILYDRYIGF